MEIKRPKPAQLVPPDAKKVFGGETIDIYRWEQKLFNGETAIYETTKRLDAVTTIPVTKEGRILILKQRQSGLTDWFWSFPGGQIDPGEEPLEAAKREMLEEAGYESNNYELWDSHQPYKRMDWAVYTFVARDCVKIGEQNLDGGEEIEVRDISFDEFLKIVEDNNFRHTDISLRILKTRLYEDKVQELRTIFGL